MYHPSLYSRGRQLVTKATNALHVDDWTFDRVGLRYLATISVWGHWFVCAVLLFELVYRPYYGVARYAAYALLLLSLIGFNGYLHYRLRSDRTITRQWLLALYTLDVVLLSAVMAISNGFSHYFLHLFYYPALAAFAVIFTSFRFTMAWVTIVAVAYIGISLTAGDGVDFEVREEKALLARIAVMYMVVATVTGLQVRADEAAAGGGARAHPRT